MPEDRPRTPSARSGAMRGLDQSSVMGVELLTGTLTWAGLGWLVDRWLGTGPWFLAIGALLGNAAGIYLVFLRARRMDALEAARAGGTPT
jgi:F0F1-type ATP synthase assembly protein I